MRRVVSSLSHWGFYRTAPHVAKALTAVLTKRTHSEDPFRLTISVQIRGDRLLNLQRRLIHRGAGVSEIFKQGAR